jgi:hypothetical protein
MARVTRGHSMLLVTTLVVPVGTALVMGRWALAFPVGVL